MTETPLIHVERLDANGNPTARTLCGGVGRIAVNTGRADCETCIDILNGELPHPNDTEDEEDVDA